MYNGIENNNSIVLLRGGTFRRDAIICCREIRQSVEVFRMAGVCADGMDQGHVSMITAAPECTLGAPAVPIVDLHTITYVNFPSTVSGKSGCVCTGNGYGSRAG